MREIKSAVTVLCEITFDEKALARETIEAVVETALAELARYDSSDIGIVWRGESEPG